MPAAQALQSAVLAKVNMGRAGAGVESLERGHQFARDIRSGRGSERHYTPDLSAKAGCPYSRKRQANGGDLPGGHRERDWGSDGSSAGID